MKENFEVCLALVLRHEGGYTNHPSDPGGMTNLGITKGVWENWTGRPTNEAEMRAITVETAGPIYKAKYWDKVKCDSLSPGLDYVVFDYAVNSGIGRSAKTLQTVCGAPVDGMVGKNTLAAVASFSPSDLINKICDSRQAFLERLTTFKVFGKGWTRRVSECRAKGLSMVSGA
ncbi:MAG: hypothetical protein JW395_1586 [Nitrospira sp.]|nr:hypothetical protein [Nitrospira sp.]